MGHYRAEDLVPDSDLRRAAVRHDRHGRERARLVLAMHQHVFAPVLHRDGAAVDIAVVQPCARSMGCERLQSGILDRLARCDYRHLVASIEKRLLKSGKAVGEGAVDNAGGIRSRKFRHVQQPDAGPACPQSSGQLGHGKAERGQDAHPCYRNASLRHGQTPLWSLRSSAVPALPRSEPGPQWSDFTVGVNFSIWQLPVPLSVGPAPDAMGWAGSVLVRCRPTLSTSRPSVGNHDASHLFTAWRHAPSDATDCELQRHGGKTSSAGWTFPKGTGVRHRISP